MNATGTGIGSALRRAREVRGKTLEEASRETRIRTEYLTALEREAFDRLLGDVYVRGFLRSYSSYLGLDADKVLSVYARAYGRHRATVPPSAPVSPAVAPTAEGHPLIHRRANWRLAGVAAIVGLSLVAAIALVSRSGGSDPVADGAPASIAPTAHPVVVNLVTVEPVEATIVVDGQTVFEGTLAREEARSYEGQERIEVSFAVGAAVRLNVNGTPLGLPGIAGEPFADSYGPEDHRRSPSSGG